MCESFFLPFPNPLHDLNNLKKVITSRQVDPQIVEILKLNEEDIVILYKDKTTVTAIAKGLNTHYEGQLDKITVTYPNRDKNSTEMLTKETEPKVTGKQVKEILVRHKLMTVEEAKPKKRVKKLTEAAA